MVRFFPPTVALITEVAAAHLEGLGSVEGVLEAKFEITESPVLKAFFYNGDNPLLVSKSCSLPDSVRSLSLGFEKGDFRIQSTRFSLDDGLPNLTFDFVHEENVFSVRTSLFGRHSALALGFGLALRLYLGAPLGDRVLQDIGRLKAPAGRGRFFRLSCGAVMLDDSYNANPASMRASLSECARIPARRRIAVLGEMRELGGDALEYHRDLLEFLKDFCKVFLMGKIWTDLFDGEPLPFNVFMFENPVRLGEELLAELQEGDLVVVKGSHGNRLDRAVTVLLEGVGS
jgi:UDP-N-acetylmuramoyl-tripeptide--D-alanyl-D-alanine ligase